METNGHVNVTNGHHGDKRTIYPSIYPPCYKWTAELQKDTMVTKGQSMLLSIYQYGNKRTMYMLQMDTLATKGLSILLQICKNVMIYHSVFTIFTNNVFTIMKS